MSIVLSQVSLWFLVIVGVINLILAIFVFRSDSESATNKIFVFLGITITFWLVTMHTSLMDFSPQINLLLIKMSLFWATLINCLFLVLGCTLPEAKIVMSRKKLFTLVAATIFVMLFTLSKLTFSGAVYLNGTYSPIPGKGIFVFPLYIVITTFIIARELIKRIKTAKTLLRKQLTLVLTGISLMLSLIVATIIIPVVVFQNSFFVPFFPLYTLFFTALTAYAIVKHKLFDIKIVATEAVTIIIWIVLVAKLVVAQDEVELVIDFLILATMVVFGILLVRSVTNEVKQREKLEELTAKLKELDKQKDEFISVAAHELRSPLTAIKGYISMVVEGDGGEIEDKARSYLSDASAVNERLIRLVNNMLNVSRIEEGRIVYQIEIVDLIKAVQEIYYSFKFEAERKSLKFNLDIPHGLSDHVKVDPDRIREVIGNYVSNAIKFTDTGSVTIKISNPTKLTIKVEVIDTGPGISKEEQDKLFRKFYRASATEGKTIGTGLGLYISKLLVEKFGGKVGLESEFGKGSNFWFELPLSKE